MGSRLKMRRRPRDHRTVDRLGLPRPRVVGHLEGDELVVGGDYGGFVVRRHRTTPAYTVDEERYARFDERNTMYSRSSWDSSLGESIMLDWPDIQRARISANRAGARREDFAFLAAASTVASTLGNFGGSFGMDHDGLYSVRALPGSVASVMPFDELGAWDPDDLSPRQVTDIVKKAARFYGASLVGVTEIDERWVYAERFGSGYTNNPETIGQHAPITFADIDEPTEGEDGALTIPRRMRWAVVMAFEMDGDAVSTSLSPVGSAATQFGYSRMAFTAGTLAEFIRALGHRALPCGNNTALSVPLAIDAGLGELGRSGLLLTPKYGPRVRLAKVFTDLPLVPDGPISFGVREYCETCGKCAEACPGGAIMPRGTQRTTEPRNESNNPGVLKWPVDAEKCHHVWVMAGHDCMNCVRSCPFNKPDTWLHRAAQLLVSARSAPLNGAMTKLDTLLGYGTRRDPVEFWSRDEHPHVKHPIRFSPRQISRGLAQLRRARIEPGAILTAATTPATAPQDRVVVDATTTPASLFDALGPRLDRHPERLVGMTARYQFQVTGARGGVWSVDIVNGAATVSQGLIERPDCTITMSDQDFLALVGGTLNPGKALLTRRIMVRGDLALATKTPRIFG